MSAIEFESFPKIARLRRKITITEKLDGTNACVAIFEILPHQHELFGRVAKDPYCIGIADSDVGFIKQAMYAGSRTRWVAPEGTMGLEKGCDNYAFGKFVHDNMCDLFKLGVGRHYGEWWGQGIRRKYGMDRKRFSLFNSHRWTHNERPDCCDVVPVLYHGPFSDIQIDIAVSELRGGGSCAAPGFMNPEGVIVYHEALRNSFKITLKGDGKPKSLAEAS